jgi:aminoglycoside phosphotransferase family enzyme/predicted kinase
MSGKLGCRERLGLITDEFRARRTIAKDQAWCRDESKALPVGGPFVMNDEDIQLLLDPASYVHSVNGPVVLHETHISWIFLAGGFAYKIKKPLKTDFLDYSTLLKRHHACCEELRLGGRYAEGLYLDVVPVTFEDGRLCVDGDAQPIEFAVRMRRFDADALLSDRLTNNLVNVDHMVQLAANIANIHNNSTRLDRGIEEIVPRIFEQAKQNFLLLLDEPNLRQDPTVRLLKNWTDAYFESHREQLLTRARCGFIRECHGDLHCGNVVYWKDHFVPFDGIEFNSEYAWIDVISDVAFLVMDLQELRHPELSSAFLNAYLEQTGDYRGLVVLRWYLVYRAMVRSKVALLRARQLNDGPKNHGQPLDAKRMEPVHAYIRLAAQLMQPMKRRMWITHGASGSGKTTGSQQIVEQQGAIRIRSDIERKRLFMTSKADNFDSEIGKGMYSPTASGTTYQRLSDISSCILQSGFDVIVDATFLKHSDRARFRRLAETEGAEFRILDFQADEATLQQRITQRRLTRNDASDATLEVLATQLRTQEPLTADELKVTVRLGDR